MQHYWSLDDVYLNDGWLTIGSFDGVHLGHQAIIANLTAGAHALGVPAIVLTFHPHPAVILRNRQGPYYLTSPEERAQLLSDFGVDVVVSHPFNAQVAAKTAEEFIAYLKEHLGFTHLCVGHDFALGRGRQGDISTLVNLGKKYGFSLSELRPVENAGHVVSSSQIRAALTDGDVRRARSLLGRPYWLQGRVIHGDGRGQTIGIPTANLEIWAERLVPRSGVYACTVRIDGIEHPAVTNIGVRPTFVERPDGAWVETHLLNYSADLYDRQLQLNFIERLRDERRFSGVDALVEQIHMDIQRAEEILQQEAS
jgi:riboflavin kinase/FMN adenylyltransferase